MVDTCACPRIQLFLPLALNIVSFLVTADRHRLTIITETEQDCKLGIHLYNIADATRATCCVKVAKNM